MPLPTDVRRARRAARVEDRPGRPARELLLPEMLKRIRRLDLRARRMVEGFLSGLHRSPGRGFSVEFSEHRKFVPGDDVKNIDWRVFARTDRLFVRQFQAETSLRAMLLVDASASMAFGGSERTMSKIEYAATLAAALAFLLQCQNDRVGLTAFDRDMHVCLQPRSTRSHLRQVLRILSRLEAGGSVRLSDALLRLGDRLRRRGMVVVFSDAFCDLGPLGRALRYLASRKQDVILFQILDRAEFRLPGAEPDFEAILRDPETLRSFPAADPNLAAVYRDRLSRHLDGVGTECGGAGIDFQLAVTDEPFDRPLWKFLDARERRR